MAKKEHLSILKRGVEFWNKWREDNPEIRPDLRKANLQSMKLVGINLSRADLTSANLLRADLSWDYKLPLAPGNTPGDSEYVRTDLRGADFTSANLKGTLLGGANIANTNLSTVDLKEALFYSARPVTGEILYADLSRANLSGSDLTSIDFSYVNLNGADLSFTYLTSVDFFGANLSKANFTRARMFFTKLDRAKLVDANFTFVRMEEMQLNNVDLSQVKGLDTIKHDSRTNIGMDTLAISKGHLPEIFLRECGLSPWEIEFSRLYDPTLTAGEISDILDVNIFRKRTEGPIYLGGIFISYSYEDSDFVDKLYKYLKEAGAPVWLDRHDMLAGSLYKQIARNIRIQDIVIVVLSGHSTESDWVEAELEMARKKEKDENRDILCPVALDDSWKKKVEGDVLWRQVKKKNILDFSGWKTRKFNSQFNKLMDGLKINYRKP